MTSNFEDKKMVPKNSQKSRFLQLLTFDYKRSMYTEVICVWERRKDALKYLLPKCCGQIPHNKKPPAIYISRVLAGNLADFWNSTQFSQHRGQQMLTKMFFSKRSHQKLQKTYLQFFHSTHTFFAIFESVFESAKSPFSKFNVQVAHHRGQRFFRVVGA